MRQLLILVIFGLVVSCSYNKQNGTSQYSKGIIRLEKSKHFNFTNQVYTFVQPRESIIVNGQPVEGIVFLVNDQLFENIAKDLGLAYSKSFYYYPNKGMDPVLFENELDTAIFLIDKVYPEIESGDTISLQEMIGIKASFRNQTHSYDTTFLSVFEFKVIGSK